LFASYKTVAVYVTRAVQLEILIQSVKLFLLCSLLVFTRVGSESHLVSVLIIAVFSCTLARVLGVLCLGSSTFARYRTCDALTGLGVALATLVAPIVTL
jgi:hypothetical protein